VESEKLNNRAGLSFDPVFVAAEMVWLVMD
jgi:hypothetical protein